MTLPKIPRKGGGGGGVGGLEKLLKGRGILRTEDAVSLGNFSSWGVANVTNVIFNYILFIVFLFP